MFWLLVPTSTYEYMYTTVLLLIVQPFEQQFDRPEASICMHVHPFSFSFSFMCFLGSGLLLYFVWECKYVFELNSCRYLRTYYSYLYPSSLPARAYSHGKCSCFCVDRKKYSSTWCREKNAIVNIDTDNSNCFHIKITYPYEQGTSECLFPLFLCQKKVDTMNRLFYHDRYRLFVYLLCLPILPYTVLQQLSL